MNSPSNKGYLSMKQDDVYVYSDIAVKEVGHIPRCTVCMSLYRSPVVFGVVVVIVVCIAAILGYSVGVGSSGCHNLIRTHRIDADIIISEGNQDVQQNLSYCLRTIEAINNTVSQIDMEQSLAYIHQLRYDIRMELDLFFGKNESLIAHHRRRPPVETWNNG